MTNLERNYLKHHGILGQKWGKRNGPPYPLDASDHSPSEKKAGRRKSLDNGSKKDENKSEKKGLTSNQKKAIVIAAVVGAAAVGAYIAYKNGVFDKTGAFEELVDLGENKGSDVLKKVGGEKVDSLLNESIIPSVEKQDISSAIKNIDSKTGFKMINESLDESLKNTNPLRDIREGQTNCVNCSIAGFLRMSGYDVTAKGDSIGDGAPLVEVAQKAFGIKDSDKRLGVLNRTGMFADSPETAGRIFKGVCGDNASGVVGAEFKNGSGYAFNWTIKDGVVEFYDFQRGQKMTSPTVNWNMIDPNGQLQIARLDGLEIDMDAIKKIVDAR